MICYEIIINSFVEKHVIHLRLFIYRASQTYFSEFSLADKRQELPDDFHQKSIVLSRVCMTIVKKHVTGTEAVHSFSKGENLRHDHVLITVNIFSIKRK